MPQVEHNLHPELQEKKKESSNSCQQYLFKSKRLVVRVLQLDNTFQEHYSLGSQAEQKNDKGILDMTLYKSIHKEPSFVLTDSAKDYKWTTSMNAIGSRFCMQQRQTKVQIKEQKLFHLHAYIFLRQHPSDQLIQRRIIIKCSACKITQKTLD